MSLRWAVALLLAVFSPLLSSLPAATSVARDSSTGYSIDVWEHEDGLPQNSVITMVQTRDGYLWLGTLNGLVRFDGIHFTVFDESNTPGLNSSRIVRLFEDSQGRLWVGTETSGTVYLKDGQLFSPAELSPGGAERRLVSVCEDASGAVWLYCANGELWRCFQGRFTPFVAAQGAPSATRTLIAEQSASVWVGTDHRQYAIGPVAADATLELPVEQELSLTNKLDLLLASRLGGYWRLADGRVQKWRTNQLERDFGPYPWPWTHPVSAACEDQRGNLVAGTLGAGLYWFDSDGKASVLSTNEGLSYPYVISLQLDREGSLWVGTDGGGLNRIKRQAFSTLDASRGFVVQSACEDARGGLWFGANNGGANLWTEGSVTRFGAAHGLFSPDVLTVFADRKDRLWAGTKKLGLFQLRNGRFAWPVGVDVTSPAVYAIHQDRAGVLWFGTHGGLLRWDEQTWKRYTTADGLSADVVRAIAEDNDGSLWIGTVGGGLNRLREGQFTVFRKKDGLPSDDISALWLDADSALWIGTFGSGLARFHQERWTHYSTKDGLISNGVGYLIEDGEGYLWVGSNDGLMRITKKSLNDLARGLTNVVTCRVYGKADGLPSRECTQGSQPGACRSADGRFWFPTIKGLASVAPSHLKANPVPPPVVIESVLIDDQNQETNRLRSGWSGLVTMKPSQERLEIRYTSLNLAAPDRARFRFRMEGHVTRWTDAGDSRVARYSKLPPDRYRFQVLACNEDGVWNEAGAAIDILVEPPFWRTWWFLTGAVLLLISGIVAVVHYVSTQRLQRQLESMRRKEALERERARIARDLHDQLGANLTQVALLGEMAESDKDLPEEVESHARQICATARETTRALDEIVWAANPENDTLEGLINYACKYAQDYFALAGLRYRLETPSHQLPATPLPPDLRHNVFLAFKEAVNNVVKHAQATEARVRLHLEVDRFTLEIQDNGRGCAEAASKTGRNGLRNMRRRMEDVGGTFSISPAPEQGTIVRLSAPRNAAPAV